MSSMRGGAVNTFPKPVERDLVGSYIASAIQLN